MTIWKKWKRREKLQKFEYLQNLQDEMSFLDDELKGYQLVGKKKRKKRKEKENSGHKLEVTSSKCKTPLPLGANVMSEC